MKILHFIERILSDKIGYFSQKQLGKSVIRQLLFLFSIIGGIIFLFGCIFAIHGVTFDQGNVFWFALLSLLGPDSLYTIQKESSYIKALSLFLTFIGIIIFNGIFVAIVVSTIHTYFDEIKRGTGRVNEDNTIVILGWNELVPSILSELNLYCKTERKRIKVILLSEEPKSEIVQIIKINRYIEIFFRTGASYKATDLKRLNLINSRAILVFCDIKKEAMDFLTQDSYVIKTFISLHSLFSESKAKSIPILLNFHEMQNSEYLNYIHENNTVFFNKNYYNAKFISLLLLNPSYYYIFHELLSYEGSEIYFCKSLFAGKTFQSVIGLFPLAIPIGIRRNNDVILTPSPDYVIAEKDELIVIADSEKSFQWNEIEKQIDILSFYHKPKSKKKKSEEVICIIGMNSRLLYVIEEFEKLGKQIYIYANESEIKWKSKVMKEKSARGAREIFIYPCEFNSESEIIKRIPLERFDKILVLTSEEILGNGKSTLEDDTDTLYKVLKLIHLKKKNPEKYKYQILCEIQNPENEEIVRKIPESNFNYVLGNLIVAKILNMELINPGILQIYKQLLQKGDIDLDIQPLSLYLNVDTDFQTLLENFYKQKKYILIGYIDTEKNQIFLNPNKATMIKPQNHLIILKKSDYKIRETLK